jgi:hypothetical protein
VVESDRWIKRNLPEWELIHSSRVRRKRKEKLMENIHINSFVRRQTPESSFTHFEGTDKELLQKIDQSDKIKPGYREGVMLVILLDEEAEGFFTGLVTLQEGDRLVGNFESRVEGESPRISIRATGYNSRHARAYDDCQKQPCKRVEVVLYSHAVLEEDGDAESDKPWEVIALNGYPYNEDVPINPNTLMHNHFKSDGGTATNMTPEEFEKALRESFIYWKDKALLEEKN